MPFNSHCSYPMKCRFCNFVSSSQEGLLRHHRLRHGRGAHWPCVYSDCVCTFKTPGALKSHLTRSHCRTARRQETSTFFCESCEFREICTQFTFFTHLGHHLKNQQTVRCPFLRCEFKTNNLKTFSSHRSRKCPLSLQSSLLGSWNITGLIKLLTVAIQI